MTHDDIHLPSDQPSSIQDPERPPCPARRTMLGCALALGVTQFLGAADAAAATAGKWTSAGALSTFAIGKPKLVKLVGGQAPVFITKLSATSWQCLFAVCTHEVYRLNLAPGHPNYAFHCPNHGAKFTKTGQVFDGPAERALFKLPVRITKGKVMVNVAGFV